MTADTTLPASPPADQRTDIPETPFFATSVVKLGVLSVCTLGLYELYWFYRNWRLMKAREALGISPFWRAFFAPLYCYQCFSRIRSFGLASGLTRSLPAGALAAAWIVVALTWRLPHLYWLVSLFSFVPMLPVQTYVNRINTEASPQHDPNGRFSAFNWAGVIIGGAFLALAVLGSLLPEQ